MNAAHIKHRTRQRKTPTNARRHTHTHTNTLLGDCLLLSQQDVVRSRVNFTIPHTSCRHEASNRRTTRRSNTRAQT